MKKINLLMKIVFGLCGMYLILVMPFILLGSALVSNFFGIPFLPFMLTITYAMALILLLGVDWRRMVFNKFVKQEK